MRIHISSGQRKPYRPKVGDRKETKAGLFRRVPRLAWMGGNRYCRQVSGNRPLYDWIEEKYFDEKGFGRHYRTEEWWSLQK